MAVTTVTPTVSDSLVYGTTSVTIDTVLPGAVQSTPTTGQIWPRGQGT